MLFQNKKTLTELENKVTKLEERLKLAITFGVPDALKNEVSQKLERITVEQLMTADLGKFLGDLPLSYISVQDIVYIGYLPLNNSLHFRCWKIELKNSEIN